MGRSACPGARRTARASGRSTTGSPSGERGGAARCGSRSLGERGTGTGGTAAPATRDRRSGVTEDRSHPEREERVRGEQEARPDDRPDRHGVGERDRRIGGGRSRRRGAAVAQSRRRRRSSRRRAGASRRPGSAPSRRGRGAVQGRGQRRSSILVAYSPVMSAAADDDRELGEDDAGESICTTSSPSPNWAFVRLLGGEPRRHPGHQHPGRRERDERPALRAELCPLGAEGRSHESPRSRPRAPPVCAARAARWPKASLRRGAGRLEPVERHAVGREHRRDVRRGHALDRDARAPVRAHRGAGVRARRGRHRGRREASVSRQSRPRRTREQLGHGHVREETSAPDHDQVVGGAPSSLMRWLETKTVRPSAASVQQLPHHWIPPGRGRWSARRGSGSAGRRGAPRRRRGAAASRAMSSPAGAARRSPTS